MFMLRQSFTGKTPYKTVVFGMQFAYKGFDISTDFVFKEGNHTYTHVNMTADGAGMKKLAVAA
jgi:hypothetical protein